VLVGGAFLLTPGVLTDLAGFALLFPLSRRWIQGRVRRRLERGIAEGSIRVATMGPGGFAGWGAEGRGGLGERGPRASSGLDPSKGIVIEPEDP
jgi:UPF0716 protein FxsA